MYVDLPVLYGTVVTVCYLAAHMVMWVMSDRGIPRSYRMMQGFGVNTCTSHTFFPIIADI